MTGTANRAMLTLDLDLERMESEVMQQNPIIADALEEFLQAKRVERLSPKYIDWLESLLKPFRETFQQKHVADITTAHVRQYLTALMNRKTHIRGGKERQGAPSAHTYAAYDAAIRLFFGWATAEYDLSADPMTRIKKPSKPSKAPKAANPGDIRLLLAATSGDDPLSLRNRAIILFILDTGCRAGGVAGLELSTLDLALCRARVTEKGEKERTVYFTRRTADTLRAWLNVRPASTTNTVFVSLSGLTPGKELTPGGISQIFSRLKKAAGIRGNINPHSLRHAFATNAAKQGVNMAVLAALLGHESMSTTQQYTKFTDNELAEQHARYSPVNYL
jgi:site-specific recombinase XerD